MTRDESKRLTVVEVDVKYLRVEIDKISGKLDRLHDAAARRAGAASYSGRLGGWLKTTIGFAVSLCAGGMGAWLTRHG